METESWLAKTLCAPDGNDNRVFAARKQQHGAFKLRATSRNTKMLSLSSSLR
jgi:hypothetical protein